MFRLTTEGAKDDDKQFKMNFLDRIYRIDWIKFHPVNPVILSNRIFTENSYQFVSGSERGGRNSFTPL